MDRQVVLVENVDAAYRNVLHFLVRTKGYRLEGVKRINASRYILVKGSPENLLVMYKRETFHNFGLKFRKLGYVGVGDSVNVDDLKEALKFGVSRIYCLFPDDGLYSISINDFVLQSVKWRNKEGKDVRSVSIHAYKKEEGF